MVLVVGWGGDGGYTLLHGGGGARASDGVSDNPGIAGSISHGNVHETNTWKYPIQTECG